MKRSYTLLFIALIFVTLMNQCDALISFSLKEAQRSKYYFGGKFLHGLGESYQRPEILEAIESNDDDTDTLFPSRTFDSDIYREKMVDLVYKSSMERFS